MPKSQLLQDEAAKPASPVEGPCVDVNDSLSEARNLPLPRSESELELESPPRIGKALKRNVSFASIEIRHHSVVIGDHPCCSMGCPLALGWEYADGDALPVDEYEASRSPRRSRQELRTTCEERRQLLLDEYSEGEIRLALRKLHRERSCSAKLSERMSKSFFCDQHEV
jgi:hypothetical protein